MPMLKTGNIIAILFFIASFSAEAQFYDMGQDPASVKWNIIKTEHFRIIFPEGIEAQAQHIANGFEQVYEPLSSGMNIKAVKVPVILHNRSVTSNAVVPWAPKRIEFYTCPGQDDYPQPWADQLMLHEFRHVVQYSKINQGLTKVLSYVFGQQITAGVIGTFVPMWFVEGDAVYTETLFSSSGRGRMPWFSMKLAAQVREKGIYNYNKAVFGSYKTFTPNHYELGYQLVSYGTKKYSHQIWERAMDKSGKLPLMVVPFNHGIKKVSGLNKVQIYKNCLNELDSLWQKTDNKNRHTDFTLLSTKKNKFYTNYNWGNFSGNHFIAVKSSMDDITRFVILDSSGNEKHIFTPGTYYNTAFSSSGNQIVWTETAYDPRWENRTYSVIKLYDFQKKRSRQLTHRSRYFSPSLDDEGTQIVCTEQNIYGNSSLLVLDANSGKIKKQIPVDSGDFIMTPKWSDKGAEIVFIALNRFGKRLCIADTAGHIRNITNPSFTEISHPALFGKYIYFTGAYSGISNIYGLDTSSQELYQLTSSKYGASEPELSSDGTQLLYSDYTENGYKLVKAEIDTSLWISVKNFTGNSLQLFDVKNEPIDFYNSKKNQYPVRKISKFLNLFNIHSWGPLSINADNTTVKPGFEIKSQNLLSTMFFSAGYEHEWNNSGSMFFAKLSYRAWYPVIDVGFAYEFNKDDSIRWNTMSLSAGLKVPLNLTRGKHVVFVQPQLVFSYKKIIARKNYPDYAFSGEYEPLEYRVYAYHIIKTSLKDISPRWGQLLELSYKHTPFNKNISGALTAIQTVFFFPGIGRHHSISLYGGWQYHDTYSFIFGDAITLPQGYDSSGYSKAVSAKFTYQMPLFYPDWSIGSLFYFKRFRTSLHFDYAYVTDKENNFYNLSSAGISLLADFHFLRFLAPITMGIRASYRFDTQKIIPEFIYSVNFDALQFKPGYSRFYD
ncbi:MAG: hypothetical protein PHR81_00940 [Bacteroidales bacterium]|nr:hypothetical protein [Bacteroidales bacterium]